MSHGGGAGPRIEDYGLLGDTQSAALVGRDGSIDWLCLPRFDSGACFARLLGDRENGRWLLAPRGEPRATRRRYRDGTLVLETEFTTADGVVRLVDAMPIRERFPDLVRIVEGVSGRVEMEMDLVVRFDYGHIVPWVRRTAGGLVAVAGPDALSLRSSVPLHPDGTETTATFAVAAGQREAFVLVWHPSHQPYVPELDPLHEVATTERRWRDWVRRSSYRGARKEAVDRSLITLKALTYEPTGGIVAAATTSLPETLGGVRNWDYRYCWLRDAGFTLDALLLAGFTTEAAAWRDWLLRAVAGDPATLQIMYGVAGERRLTEIEASWLAGYEGSTPVRIGNAAHGQLQLDVYGQVMDALYQARREGIDPEEASWDLQRSLMDYLETGWRQPDNGIWEMRGERQWFTESRIMCWVALDRAIKTVEKAGLAAPEDQLARWQRVRQEIHDDVCERGYDSERGTFVQRYGAPDLDASLLLLPLFGFLPADDARVRGTVEAIERELVSDGLVWRYQTGDGSPDGLPGHEGAFLACSFWLADCLALMGRRRDAEELFERLLGLRNDVGLLSEEYDPRSRRMMGNFPQAFSHVALVNTAQILSPDRSPLERGKRPNCPRASLGRQEMAPRISRQED